MALNSPIKFLISLADPLARPTLPSHAVSVFPSYFSKFTGIPSARSLRRVIIRFLSVSVPSVEFSPISRSIQIV
jgi:hypothetical protein